jgi:hypothetical protein
MIPTPDDLLAEGNCYENALNYVLNVTSEDLVLVHGRPTLTRAPYCQYGHAWVEQGNFCIDGGFLVVIPKALYYMAGTIDPDMCLFYMPEEARVMVLQFKHYGPWEGVDGVAPSENFADDTEE